MKAELSEMDGCFSIELIAETTQEAATIARFGLNHTKELRSIYAYAQENGEFSLSVVLGKRRDHSGIIGRKK